MDWMIFSVALMVFAAIMFALLQLSRTAWNAQARLAELQRLVVTQSLAQRPETLPVAYHVAAQPTPHMGQPPPGHVEGHTRNGELVHVPLVDNEERSRFFEDVNAP